jgi:hypothetical protein
MVNGRPHDEETSEIIKAWEIDQKRVQDEREAIRQEHDEMLRQVEEDQTTLETELRREMESMKAAARAGSVISMAAPSIVGDRHTGCSGYRRSPRGVRADDSQERNYTRTDWQSGP